MTTIEKQAIKIYFENTCTGIRYISFAECLVLAETNIKQEITRTMEIDYEEFKQAA